MPPLGRRTAPPLGRRLAGLAIAMLALGGCSVASEDEAGAGIPHNQCEKDSDCGEGGVCMSTPGVCVAKSGQFSTVLFEISAPSSATEFSGVRFIQTRTDVPADGTRSGDDFTLMLDLVATVSGSVAPTRGAHQQDCNLDYQGSATVPVSLTFTPSERLLGLPTQSYTAKAEKVGDEYAFHLDMPAGVYDLYVEPDQDLIATASPTACAVVPQLFKDVAIESGSVALNLSAAPPSQLTVTVDWQPPGTADVTENALTTLEGWSVDVMDPTTGRILSAPATLEATADGYITTVDYAAVVGSGTAEGKELVRLRPPDEVIAPTLVVERATLDAFSVGEGKINQLGGVPKAVAVKGSFVETADGKLVEGTTALKFVAKKLGFLKSGTLFAFERDVEAKDGAFDIDLLPGEYDVYIVPPPGSGLALTMRSLQIGKQPLQQTGKTLTVETASDLAGAVFAPTGAPLAGAPIHSVASPVAVDPLLVAAGTAPLKPQAANSVVGSDGGFILQSDPGTFDLSVRPDGQSGFAWLVRPNVAVTSPLHQLGDLTLPLPVSYVGTVSVLDDVVVPNALIRAYVFMGESGYTPDPEQASSVLQVAEARADSSGKFTLLLPSKLN
ncbi:MAG: hypothetical protein R3B13_31935 [Polyangiaceae bacterium]